MGQNTDSLDEMSSTEINSLDETSFRDEVVVDERDASTADTAEIRGEIERTRGQMSQTIDAIQERLSPDHLKGQMKEEVNAQFHAAKEAVREATIGKVENMVQHANYSVNEARYTIMDTIKQNPLPAAMVGLGLGWLFMNRRTTTAARTRQYDNRYDYRSASGYAGNNAAYRGAQSWSSDRDYDYQRSYNAPNGGTQQGAGEMIDRAKEKVGDLTDKVQQTAGNLTNQVQDKAGYLADQVQNKAGNFADQVQNRAGDFADQAQYQEQRLEERFRQILDENPLVLGAVAFAIGAAVGYALPQTDKENEWLGETRDNFVDKAQEVAKDTMGKVQRVATKATEEVKNTVKEEAKAQGLTQDTSTQSGNGLNLNQQKTDSYNFTV